MKISPDNKIKENLILNKSKILFEERFYKETS